MFQEDLSLFLADFGQPVTLLGRQVTAIFDNGYSLGTVGVTGMASTQPTLTLPTSDVPPDPVGAVVVINGSSYTIAAHEPDGTGISRLILEVGA